MTASKWRLGITRKTLAAVFAITALALLGGGYGYYQGQAKEIRQRSYENLAAISTMKIGQIVQWRKERLADVLRAVNGPVLKRSVLEIIHHSSTPEGREELRKIMEVTREGGQYTDAILLAPDGSLLLTAKNEDNTPLLPVTQQAITAALASRKPVLSDFFLEPSSHHIHVDAVAAVRDAQGEPSGVLILRCSAEDYLYPLIQSWPTPSRSAETILVKRDGQEVVFLNELRHRSNSALSLRQPLSQTDIPAVQAALGRRGMFDGKDYRNVAVLADLCAIPESPWFMITKVDRDEILAEARYRATSTGAIVGALILLAASATAFAYTRRQAGLFSKLLEAERQQRENQELFRTTLYSIGDGVLTTDTEGRLREMNPVAEQLTGWTEAEARGKPLEEVFIIINQETRATVVNPVATVLRDGVIVGLANHTLLIARDGTERAIADSAAPIRDGSGAVSGVVLVFSDVTEQYRMREALRQSEQDYRMLFEGMLEGFALHEIICDAAGQPIDYRFLSTNPAFERMTGLRAQDIIGRTVQEVLPETEKFWIERYGDVALTGEPIHFEEYSRVLGRYFEVTAFRPQPHQFAIVCADITERKAAETRIARLSQLYAALSQCNQAIVHSSTVEDLLPKICRDIVRFGGMKMAWIGLLDETEELVKPVASYGDGVEYLDGFQISRVAGHPSGQGPTGISLRENHPVWCQDFQSDPHTVPWREKCAHYGWEASASLPLCKRGKVVGVLAIYSDKVHAFDQEVRNLLEEMAGDINFALESFARETERKQAEEALRKSEARLSFALQTVRIGAWEMDLRDHTAQRDPIHDRIFGYGTLLPNWTYEIFLEHVLPEDRANVDRSFRTATATQSDWSFECRIRRADNEVRWIWAAGGHEQNPEGKPIRMAGIVRDITDRKKAEETLQQNRNMLSYILNSVPQSVFWKDRNSVYLGCNEVFAQDGGLTNPEEIIGKTDFDLPWGKHEAKNYIADDKEVMGNNQPKRHIIESLHKEDGTLLWLDTTKVPLTDSTGQVYGVLGVFENITERKQAQERLLLQSEALEAVANAIVITDSKGIIEWVNTAFTTYTGYTLAEVIGKTPSLLKAGKHDQAFYHDLWETILAGEVWHGEMINRRKDGTHYTEEMTITPMKDTRGEITHFIAVKQDITERKQMEENLLRTQRMESIGTLASGVAHDLNNILTPIILSADMLRAAEQPASRESLITSIEKCAQRGADVVNQVLTFARGTKGERITLQLDRLVHDTEKIIHETFPRNITITSAIPSDLWSIKGDPTQIHQVLLNLCINARDAMPEGGTLLILAENKTIDQNFAAMAPDAKDGDYAMLSISDTGTGIPRKILGKIFDPFFTTKEVGKGTGLGLSTVIGIVRSHGGFVIAESEEGRGSTFKVFLPTKAGEAVKKKRLVSMEIPQGRGETILVVDDEIFIAKVTSMMLEKNGYQVLSAADGNDALALYQEHADAISLVLTDIMMPGMDGVQLSRALKKINPHVKIMASTGQPTETHRAELRSLGVHVILRKPYDAQVLLTTLHEAIEMERQ